MFGGLAQSKGSIEVNVYGLNWQVEHEQGLLDKWAKDHPGITVKYNTDADYYNKILLLFMTQPEKVDIALVNPGYLVPWVEAGWLAPLDGLPGIEERKKEMLPEQVEAYSYKENFYAGGAWYEDTEFVVYNERMLKEAGFDHPPKTWDELIEQSLKIKEKGIVEYPLSLPYKPSSRRLDYVWYLISTSLSGKESRPLWSEKLEPMFLETESPGYRALQYMKDFMQKYKIVNQVAFETDTFASATEMMKGEAAFCEVADFMFVDFIDKEKCKEAGNIKLMMTPNSGYTMYKADGYAMTKSATEKGEEHKLATVEVLKYFTGPDFTKERLKKWFGPSIYAEVYRDPEIQEVVNSVISNPEVYYAQKEKSVNLEMFVDPVHQTTFYFDYLEDYLLPNLQRAILGDISINEALKNINEGVQKLKKENNF
jgi:multiple sugar transport system substrate-binding protein